MAAPPPVPSEDGEDGKAIKGRNLFGDDLATWISLIVERSGRDDVSRKDIQELVRCHWHRGIHLLWDEWRTCGEDFDKFVLRLAERGGVRAGDGESIDQPKEGAPFTPNPVPVVLRIGDPSTDIATRQLVTWVMNAKGSSPHMALMGTLGTGKTRTGVSMLKSVRHQAGCPIILFDMEKGDLASDPTLARDLNAVVIRANREPVPLDVLYAGEKTDREVNDASLRFRESFSHVTRNKLGGAQLDALREGARRALFASTPTSIIDVRNSVREVYAEKKKAEDVVVATFNDLTLAEYFMPKMSPEEFFGKSWIIDIHESPETVQRLIVFLVLDALDSFCRSLEDSAVDNHGHRAQRLVVCVDEARRILGYGHQSLVNLIRTGRSKGITLMLISQSPDDYNAEDENFLENIGLAACFRTSARSTALNSLLGQSVDLGGLPPGVCVTRLPDRPGVVRVRAWE